MTRGRAASGPDATFQDLLLQCRGRTGLTQRELAARLGVHMRSIQAWEGGVTYPGASSLKALILGYLQTGGFEPGRETAQAGALWAAALNEATRVRPPFDRAWFAGELSRAMAGGGQMREASRSQDWGEAPDILGFLGRQRELETLKGWILHENARVIALLGMGGIGKTMLAARLAADVAPAFERVYWRSVRNAPSPADWLGEAISFLSEQQLAPPQGEEARAAMLLDLLRKGRHLLVLDNLEVLLQPGQRHAAYRDGYAGFGSLIDTVGRSVHQSCLVLTSREAPPEVEELGGEHAAVHELELGGLDVIDGQRLLSDKQLHGDEAAWIRLVTLYGGNGLALKVVGQSIHQIFGGEIAAFLEQATSPSVFGGIKRLLDAQVARLSPLEVDVLRWLAVGREPVSFGDLAAALGPGVGRAALLEALEALRRRSLVERSEPGTAFTLQSVVLEYVTDRLVEQVADEIERGKPEVLLHQPLLTAQAKDFIRGTQERLVIQPIIDRFVASSSGSAAAEQRLSLLLNELRSQPMDTHGYAPGNLVNILRIMRGNLRGLDLSRLTIRQAYLQAIAAQDTSLADSHLSEVVLSAAFNFPTSVALSSDGSVLAAGTIAGEICLWRVSDRSLLRTFRGHTGQINGLAVSANGQLVASGSHDGTVRLWSATTGELVSNLVGQRGAAGSVALSDDEQLVASGAFDGIARVWDAHTGRLLASIQAHASRVRWIALGGDGLLATSDTEGTVHVWNARTGRLIMTPQPGDTQLICVALSEDGRLLATSGVDGSIRLWEVSSGRSLGVLHGHTGRIWNLALSRDGQVVASGGEDGTVRLWDARSGRALATLQGHTSAVYGVALSGTGHLAASGSFDGLVRLSDARSGRVLSTLQGHASAVWAVALSLDGRVLASGGEDGVVRLWNPSTGRQVAGLNTRERGVWGVALSGDGGLLASGGYDGGLYLWETSTGRQLATIDSHTAAFCGIALSHDGELVGSGGVDGVARVWDVSSRRLVASLPGTAALVYAVAFERSGRLFATSSFDGRVRLWEIPSGRLISELKGHTLGVCGVALRGDGQLVASGGYDRTVRVWDAAGGKTIAVLEGHTGTVWHVALSYDGQLLASSSADGTVRLWEPQTGRVSAVLHGHVGGVWSAALSRDGRLVASTGVDGTVRLWNASTGECLRIMRADRRYERLDISRLTGLSEAQRDAMFAQGAVEHSDN